MCFSATASFSAGAVLLGLGAVTLRGPIRDVEKPFALIPVLFGLQQCVEGVLWLTLPAHSQRGLAQSLVQIYALFVGVVWPILVPGSLMLMETFRWRRRLLAVLTVLGVLIALYTSYLVIFFGFTAELGNACLVYDSPTLISPVMVAIYALAVCLPFFLSHNERIRWIGVVNVLGLAVADTFYKANFPSVWCFFAALISLLIFLTLHRLKPAAPELPQSTA